METARTGVRCNRWATRLCAVLSTCGHAAAQSSFEGIGQFSPSDVSFDGTVVVGQRLVLGSPLPVRWTTLEGLVTLPLLAGASSGLAAGVSADGTVIVGSSPAWGRPSLWPNSTSVEPLGQLPPNTSGDCIGISGDGSKITGQGNIEGFYQTFLLDLIEGVTLLGHLDGDPYCGTSNPLCISADGSAIAGYDDYVGCKFRWTRNGGLVRFETPFDGEAYLRDMSSDGSVVVGQYWAPSGWMAFRWTEQGGFEDLGLIPNPNDPSSANSISDDASIVVGNYSRGAFIWTGTTGVRELRSVLIREHGLDLRGWCLASATKISGDGRTIVGIGTNPAGQSESWIARLDEPLVVPACDADWDRNGWVSGDDFDGFVDAFIAGGRTSDYDGNCFVNGDDFDQFVADFVAGC